MEPIAQAVAGEVAADVLDLSEQCSDALNYSRGYLPLYASVWNLIDNTDEGARSNCASVFGFTSGSDTFSSRLGG